MIVIQGSGWVQLPFLRQPTYYRFTARIELLNSQTILILSCQPATQTRVGPTGELEHICDWMTKNNLGLSHAKTKEIFFRSNVRPDPTTLPSYWKIHQHGSARSCHQWTFDSHRLCQQSRLLYALHVLRDHGLSSSYLRSSCRPTVRQQLIVKTGCVPAQMHKIAILWRRFIEYNWFVCRCWRPTV